MILRLLILISVLSFSSCMTTVMGSMATGCAAQYRPETTHQLESVSCGGDLTIALERLNKWECMRGKYYGHQLIIKSFLNDEILDERLINSCSGDVLSLSRRVDVEPAPHYEFSHAGENFCEWFVAVQPSKVSLDAFHSIGRCLRKHHNRFNQVLQKDILDIGKKGENERRTVQDLKKRLYGIYYGERYQVLREFVCSSGPLSKVHVKLNGMITVVPSNDLTRDRWLFNVEPGKNAARHLNFTCDREGYVQTAYPYCRDKEGRGFLESYEILPAKKPCKKI